MGSLASWNAAVQQLVSKRHRWEITDVGDPLPLQKNPSLTRHSTQLRHLISGPSLATPCGWTLDEL